MQGIFNKFCNQIYDLNLIRMVKYQCLQSLRYRSFFKVIYNPDSFIDEVKSFRKKNDGHNPYNLS